jgi:hypothetical protein
MTITPVTWLATLICDGQDADLVNQQRVNDAARKTPQRHTAIGSLEALVAWLDRMSERGYIKL